MHDIASMVPSRSSVHRVLCPFIQKISITVHSLRIKLKIRKISGKGGESHAHTAKNRWKTDCGRHLLSIPKPDELATPGSIRSHFQPARCSRVWHWNAALLVRLAKPICNDSILTLVSWLLDLNSIEGMTRTVCFINGPRPYPAPLA